MWTPTNIPLANRNMYLICLHHQHLNFCFPRGVCCSRAIVDTKEIINWVGRIYLQELVMNIFMAQIIITKHKKLSTCNFHFKFCHKANKLGRVIESITSTQVRNSIERIKVKSTARNFELKFWRLTKWCKTFSRYVTQLTYLSTYNIDFKF